MGVALAPLDCGGGHVLWWTLVVVAHAVGCWAISTTCLCAAPGPKGLVEGAGGALQLLLRSRTIEVVGGWWCMSIGDRAIGIAHLCTTPGPFNPVDREGEGV